MKIRISFFVVFASAAASALAQINPMIPLMVQPLQLQNPILQMQQIEQLRSIQLQNEQAKIQMRALEEQRQQEAKNQQKNTQENSSQKAPSIDPLIQDWLKAAGPRMHLYADFEKVVFAPDVSINLDMIRLMSRSQFAADIAYYLGTHKMETLAISQMALLDAARAVDRIEAEFKKKSQNTN